MHSVKTLFYLLSITAGICLARICWGVAYNIIYAPPPPLELHVSAASVIGPHPDFRGDQNAPYTLVEFADYQCPPCKAADAQVGSVLNRYKGKVRLTFRNYPLPFHEYALPAALAAETARRQGKFWPMHDALYASQNELSAANAQIPCPRRQTARHTG